mmetsp:Transcript_14137/g.20906  ORF Transcript_14137/g.20906 Transcript_14137/m.20906 type:complete len:647 (-) Transcript_14137:157-2097(-)
MIMIGMMMDQHLCTLYGCSGCNIFCQMKLLSSSCNSPLSKVAAILSGVAINIQGSSSFPTALPASCFGNGIRRSSIVSANFFYLNKLPTFQSSYNSGFIGTSNRQLSADNAKNVSEDQSKPKIAIIGGGIAGVTAAAAIGARVSSSNVEIIMFEADGMCLGRGTSNDANSPPLWKAATARNANCVVPGASMNVMSQRKSVMKILRDTVKQWVELKSENAQRFLFPNDVKLLDIDNFEKAPPYFAFHFWHCIGPPASSDERAVFFTFMRRYLTRSFLTGKKEAEDRAQYIVQLTRANRSCLDGVHKQNDAAKHAAKNSIFHRGFLSLYRSREQAQLVANEVNSYGEEAVVLSDEEAALLEPHIANLHVPRPLFAVYRPKDMVGDCALYCKNLAERCTSMGIQYKHDASGNVSRIELTSAVQGKFKINLNDGSSYRADIVVLAAGVRTPLFARQLGAGYACPTYPLRGFSLTLNDKASNAPSVGKNNGRTKVQQPPKSSYNLSMAFSIDQIYCSSVPGITRLTGFGEIGGFPKDGSPQSVGPYILSRYARSIFNERAEDISETAVECYRPISSDDLPIVGEVRDIEGLFLHTGHGTLGWSLCSATSECLAQSIVTRLEREGDSSVGLYELSDGSYIARSVLSPNRFTD